jgi:Asp-tRNA(Asn)/Glu-tRNA(Gln) amidotransferase A subunit family amidase
MAPEEPLAGTLAGRRVGVSQDLHDVPLAAAHAAAYQRTIETLGGLGAQITEVRLPQAAQYRDAFTVIQMAEAYDVHHRTLVLFPASASAYGADVRGRLERARLVDIGTYLAASERRLYLADALHAALARVDVLVTPVNPGTPPRRDDPDHVIGPDGARRPFRDVIMGYTVPQNLAGVPAVTIRAGTDERGIPCGVQLTAARGNEFTALRLAEILEQAMAPTDGHDH